MADKAIPQRKRLAMGEVPHKYAAGGMVLPKAAGIKSQVKRKMNPLQKAKMQNGVPGYCEGGKK
jgi:hypothetical protein